MRTGQALSDGYSGVHAHHARARATALAAYRAQAPSHVPMAMSVQAQTQTRSGFTLAEERILQAHETGHHPYQQQQQQQQTRLAGDIAPRASSRPRGVNTVRQGPYAQPSFPPRISPGFSPIAPTSMMSEDEFHASAQGRHHLSSYQRPHHYQIDMADGNTIEGPNDFSPSSPSDFPYSNNNNNHDRPQQHNEPISSDQNSKYQASQVHVRSTTLPSSPFNQRPYRSRQHYSSSSFPPSSSDNLSRVRSNNYINTGNHNINQEYNSNNDSESPLVSPSLTYSSRTPSTLSPATPFFGSFAHAQENFKGHVEENFEGFGSGLQGEKQARMDNR